MASVTVNQPQEHRSTGHGLMPFLRTSRDNWKPKCQEAEHKERDFLHRGACIMERRNLLHPHSRQLSERASFTRSSVFCLTSSFDIPCSIFDIPLFCQTWAWKFSALWPRWRRRKRRSYSTSIASRFDRFLGRGTFNGVVLALILIYSSGCDAFTLSSVQEQMVLPAFGAATVRW